MNEAKFEKPCTAAETAMKIIAEQRKQGREYLDSRNNDAEQSGANDVAGSASEDGNNGVNPFDAAIDNLKFD